MTENNRNRATEAIVLGAVTIGTVTYLLLAVFIVLVFTIGLMWFTV